MFKLLVKCSRQILFTFSSLCCYGYHLNEQEMSSKIRVQRCVLSKTSVLAQKTEMILAVSKFCQLKCKKTVAHKVSKK